MGVAGGGWELMAPVAGDRGQRMGEDLAQTRTPGSPPWGKSNKTLTKQGLCPVFLASPPCGQDTPTDTWDGSLRPNARFLKAEARP